VVVLEVLDFGLGFGQLAVVEGHDYCISVSDTQPVEVDVEINAKARPPVTVKSTVEAGNQ
jgi:hypothetical protein